MKKTKKISVWMLHEITNIYVRVKRKRKLTDLYPQRALLEESRKQSSLVHANDWIDHDYYENLVEKSEDINQRIIDKYAPRINKKQGSPTKNHPVPRYDI